MYHCFNCKREFEEYHIGYEVHYECPEHPTETFCLCPYCGDMNIEEVEDND